MMRFHTAISSGLAALLVVPLLAQQDELRTLQEALTRTHRALDALAEIQQRIQEDPLAGIQLIVASTEAPTLDERARDERLQTLRDEVNRLRMQLDALEVPGSGPLPLLPPAGTSAPGSQPSPPLASGSTSLDDEVRRALQRLNDPRPSPTTRQSTHEPTRMPEGPGYSADRLRQARTSYRAGRYQEGLDLLKNVSDDPVGLYWKARCLEKLERIPEAIEVLKLVIEVAPDSLEGRRAKTDIEFLSWRKDFVEKLPKGLSKDKQGPKKPSDAGGGA